MILEIANKTTAMRTGPGAPPRRAERLLALALLHACLPGAAPTLLFVCSERNDVWQLMRATAPAPRRFGSAGEALASGWVPGDALLLLADGYPGAITPFAQPVADALGRGLAVFAEFSALPASLAPGATPQCVNATAGEAPAAVATTSLVPLCAPAPGSTVSHVAYTGVRCAGRGILWTAMRTLDPKPGIPHPGTACAWSAAGKTAAWRADYTGGCGVAPVLVPGLPTTVCGAAPAPAPTPPTPTPPPPTPVALSWKLRAVVTTDTLPGLDRWQILQPQSPTVVPWCPSCGARASRGCRAVCDGTLLAAAQVAGVGTAAFGADADAQMPLLFHLPAPANTTTALPGEPTTPSPPLLVAATKLSSMVTGRFGPKAAWRQLWTGILRLLHPATPALEMPDWQPVVRPTYALGAAAPPLPPGAVVAAIRSSAVWSVQWRVIPARRIRFSFLVPRFKGGLPCLHSVACAPHARIHLTSSARVCLRVCACLCARRFRRPTG